ncbi:MAG: cytochrome b N-terminal domain-containing protein [Vicinamibacterales bacterium]
MKSLADWLDRRTGVRGLLREALDEPIPGGAKLAYVFGSGLLFLFLSQVITGVFLALYYVPSADHAHTTVAYIVKEVTSGSFLRSLHSYGSSAMIVLLLLHVGQTVLYGSYKGYRELLWLAGCVLFALIVGMAFTGYLLPWDQKAYFATAVGTNIAGEIPLIGSWVQRFIRGGADMGTLTVSRFFVAHVFLLPAAIFAFIAAHVYLFRKAGAAGPPTPSPQRVESFYPRQVLMDMGWAFLLIAGLGLLAAFLPVELGPEANPADTRFLPRPEWYYVPMFQWLKYWKGSRAIVGIVIIPGILAALFAGLPFFDRRPERRPWRRPISVGAFMLVIVGLVGLGVASHVEDLRDPAIAQQLAAQRDATRAYMEDPFEPEESSGSLKAANTALADPVRARGKELYEAQGCDACHGGDGHGTPGGPPLVGVGTRLPAGELARMLKTPSLKMSDGGMTPLDLSDTELAALVEYVNSLR